MVKGGFDIEFKGRYLSKILLYIVLFFISLVVMLPILNVITTSVSSSNILRSTGGLSIIPKEFNLLNYKLVLSNTFIVGSFLNSILITIVGTFLNLIMTSMAAFALIKKSLPGRKLFMYFLIFIMVFEPGIIPEYLVVKNLGLLNSTWSIILYKGVNVYYLILLMRFFEEIPESITEAAEIDGANLIHMFFKIMLPLCKPAIATIGLFYAVFHWNEYFKASIYLDNPSKWPLQVILRQFVVLEDTTSLLGANTMFNANQMSEISSMGLQSATIVIAMIPIIFIYPLILKCHTKGVMDGSVKE